MCFEHLFSEIFQFFTAQTGRYLRLSLNCRPLTFSMHNLRDCCETHHRLTRVVPQLLPGVPSPPINFAKSGQSKDRFSQISRRCVNVLVPMENVQPPSLLDHFLASSNMPKGKATTAVKRKSSSISSTTEKQTKVKKQIPHNLGLENP